MEKRMDAQPAFLENNRRSASYESQLRLTNGEVLQESSNFRGGFTPVKSVVPVRIPRQKH